MTASFPLQQPGLEFVGSAALTWNGIGNASDADEAIGYLTGGLGEPTGDSGWFDTGYDPSSQDDQCQSPEMRYVSWQNLRTVFAAYDPVAGTISERRTLVPRTHTADMRRWSPIHLDCQPIVG